MCHCEEQRDEAIQPAATSWQGLIAEFILNTFAEFTLSEPNVLSVNSANVLAMTCECQDLSRETTQRGAQEQDEKGEKSKNQMANGGPTGLLGRGLGRFHAPDSLRGVGGPRSA